MTTADGVDQRTRILDAALVLMGDQGAQPTTMRQLAGACGINVATLYHYFPSKAELLRAVIEERNYLGDMSIDRPPLPRTGTPRHRLNDFIQWLAEMAVAEAAVWKLVMGETLRGEPIAVDMARQLASALEAALLRWIPEVVPEFDGDVAAASRLIRSSIFSLLVDRLIVDEDGVAGVVEQRAADLAAVLIP